MNPFGGFGPMPGMPPQPVPMGMPGMPPQPMPMPGMPMGPGMRMPFGMPPPSDIHGKIRYKYVTAADDGLPPMEGAPPAPTLPDMGIGTGMGMPFGPGKS